MIGLRLQPGAVFAGDYRVERPLGRGGMGAVYAVEQVSTGYPRVLKLMHAHLADDAELRRRFVQEARVGAKIKSDHVVQVIASGVDDDTGTPWLVMELLEGEDLAALVQREGLLPIPRIRTIVAQLGHALAAAFEADVVHRDLKPENLFIAASRRKEASITLKVLDFGIAKVLSEATTHTTAPVGTLAWMAPEQADRSGAITARTDVWPVGLIAYFLLTGEHYWRTAKGTAAELLYEMMVEPLAPASQRAASTGAVDRLPAGFDAWFARSVARDPNDRFAHGGEACAALEALLAGGDSPAPTTEEAKRSLNPSLAEAVAETQLAPPKGTSPEPEKLPSGKGRTGRATRRGAIAGFIAIAIVAVLITRWPLQPPSPTHPSSSPSASAAPPRPTAVTDLPPPFSKSPEALAAYAAAMQAIRDANWEHARERLEQAVALDPTFAAAHLRLVMCLGGDEAARRAAYARAEQGRSALSERDRMLLRALELQLDYAPPDQPKLRALYREMAERFPLDAEVAGLVAETEDDLAAAERAINHALSLDPMDANLWHTKAVNLAEHGKGEEALKALDRCLAISPRSYSCLYWRARALDMMGRCEDAEGPLQKALLERPDEEQTLRRRVELMRGLERSEEAIVEVLERKWSRIPPARRRVAELLDRIDLSIDHGDFVLAEEQTRALRAAITADLSERYAGSAMFLTIKIYHETGRDRDAARVAEEHLRKMDAWQGYWQGIEAFNLLYIMVRGGLLSKDELAARKLVYHERIQKKTPPFSPMELWLIENQGVLTREDAAEAVAKRPPGELAASGRYDLSNIAYVYLLAGNYAEALTVLKGAMSSCGSIRVDRTRTLWLGQALEGTGDKAGACREYAKVIRWWGKAKPRSVTAEEARRRAKALGCEAAAR